MVFSGFGLFVSFESVCLQEQTKMENKVKSIKIWGNFIAAKNSYHNNVRICSMIWMLAPLFSSTKLELIRPVFFRY